MHRKTGGWRRLLAVAVVCVGCSLMSVAARAAEPITIGFGMALTGGLAAAGKSALLAMARHRQRQGRVARPSGEARLL